MKGKEEVRTVVIPLRCVLVWCDSLRQGSVFEEAIGRLCVMMDQAMHQE